MATFTRRSITAALVQLKMTALPEGLATSVGFEGDQDVVKETIARAQSISTNDAMPYARVKQIGYGTIVEDVPLFMEASGQLSVIEVLDAVSLYRFGIVDFQRYLRTCSRDALDISIQASCGNGQTKQVDLLTSVKFTAVARAIDVGGQLVTNSASFYFIRPLNDSLSA